MGSNVFANGLEVSCEKADNQSLASMPDVCLSPPSPPAGPVPIPYPNFSSASDTTDGTKTVQIQGGQVGMKNQSCYKQSKGDEAATKSLGMGVTSGCIQGKCYFSAWSSDVEFEGANAVRFSDLTGSNSQSPSNTENVTASTGTLEPPGKDPECEKLEQGNADDRSKMPSNLAGSGTTNTNFNFESNTPGVPSASAAAHSRVAATDISEKHWEGTPAVDRKKANNPDGKSNVACPEGGNFHYSNQYFKGGHTEARIVETLFKNSAGGKVAGTLTMKIDWRPSKPAGSQSSAPCEYCHALLCAAAKCGIEVYLCTKEGKKEPLDPDKDCHDKLDMRDENVRKQMKIKNTILKKRLGG
jgi:hypothetical protein